MSVYERSHIHGLPGEKVEEVEDDEWETDPDYVNDVTEKQQRYGSKIIQPMKDQILTEETPSLIALGQKVVQKNNEAVMTEYIAKKTLYGETTDPNQENLS